MAVSRGAGAAGSSSGVRWVRGGVGEARSLRPALDGARAVFLVLGGELNFRGERPGVLMEAVADAGVERIVLVSSQVSATRPEAASHARLREFEAAVRASGREFTILRPGIRLQRPGLGGVGAGRAHRLRALRRGRAARGRPGGHRRRGRRRAAGGRGHAGRVYELTGPEPIGPRRQAEVPPAALGEGSAVRGAVAGGGVRGGWRGSCRRGSSPARWTCSGRRCRPSGGSAPMWRPSCARPAAPFAEWVARHLPAFA